MFYNKNGFLCSQSRTDSAHQNSLGPSQKMNGRRQHAADVVVESFWAGDNRPKIIYKGSLHFFFFLICITINYLSFYIRILLVLNPSSM